MGMNFPVFKFVYGKESVEVGLFLNKYDVSSAKIVMIIYYKLPVVGPFSNTVQREIKYAPYSAVL